MNIKMIKIPSGPDWQSKLTNEEKLYFPCVENEIERTPPTPKWSFLSDKDVIDIKRRLRLIINKLNNDKRGTPEALFETIKRITENAIIPKALHIYPWNMNFQKKRKERNGRK